MFNDITPLQFYCHKILPLVYDDSLSYYEVLCKVQQKLNELIENNNELIRQWELYKNEIDKAFGEYKKQLQAELDEMREDISAFEEMINAEIADFKSKVNTQLANQTKAINDFKTEVNNRLAEQDTDIQNNYDAMLRAEAQHKAEVKNTLDGFEQTMNTRLDQQDTTIQENYETVLRAENQHKLEVKNTLDSFEQTMNTRLSQQDATIQSNNEAMLRSEAQHKADVQKILDGFEAKLNKAIADYNRSVEEIPSLVNTQVNKWFTDNLDSLIAQITSKIKFPKPLVQMCDEKVYAQIRKDDVNTDIGNKTYVGHAMSVVDVNSEVLGVDNVASGTKIKVMFTLSHVNINAWDCSIALYGLDEEHDYTGFKKMILIPHSLAYPGLVLTMFADSQYVYYVVGKDLYKMAISTMLAAENGAEIEGTKVIELVVTPSAGCMTEKGEMYFFSSRDSMLSSSITYYSAVPNPPNVVPSPATIIFNYNHFWRQGSFTNPDGEQSLQFMYTDSENIYVGGRNNIDGFCNRIDVYTRKDIASNGSQYLPIANLECGGGACYNNKEVYFLHEATNGGLLFTGTNRVTTADFDYVRGNLVQKNNVRMFNTNDYYDVYCNMDYTGFFVDGTSSRPYNYLQDALNSYSYINAPNVAFNLQSDMYNNDFWNKWQPIVVEGFKNGVNIYGDGAQRKIVHLAFKDCAFVRINNIDVDISEGFSSLTVHDNGGSLYFENCSYVEVVNTKVTDPDKYAISAINTPVHIQGGCEIVESGGTATFYSDSTGAIYFDSDVTLPEGASIESPHANMLPADIKNCISMASSPLSETIPDISGCNIKDVKRDGKYKYDTTDVSASTSNLPNVLSGTVWLTVKNLGSDVIEYETVGLNTSFNNASWCGYMSSDTLSWRPKHGYSVGVTLTGTTGTLTVLYTGTGLSFIHGAFTVTDTITSGSVLYTFGGTNVFNCGAGENPIEISNSSGAVSHGLNIKNNQIVATHDITAGTYNVSGEFAVTYKSI